MAQAAIERNFTRPSSGMLDSWKRSNLNEVHKRNRNASSSIILPEPVNEKNPSEVQPAEKKRRVTIQEPAKEQLRIATNTFLSQISTTHLLEEEIFKLGLECLKKLKEKHKDAGYKGSFWGNISTSISEQHSNDDSSTQHRSSPASNDSSTQPRNSTGSSEGLSENHPVQNSEFLSSDGPAPNDSSTQHQSSTGSSEGLTENQKRTSIQNLLVSLGIISKNWTQEDKFLAKFTVKGTSDNIRTRALLVVLSSFLHHRSNDQQHPQTRKIEELFLKFKPAMQVISLTSEVETELSDFQYRCECPYDADQIQFIQEISKVVSEAIMDEVEAPHFSRCLFSLKIGSATTETTDPGYALPLSIPVTINSSTRLVLQVAAAIYYPIYVDSSSTVAVHRVVVTFCRSSFHCGGYYIVTTDEDTIKLLEPKLVEPTVLLPTRRKFQRRDYIIKELIFIQTESQSYEKPKYALEEEIIWGTNSMLKPVGLRTFLHKNDLIENDILDPVIDLVYQSIQQQPRAADNILLPAQFYQVVVKGCDTLDAALECEKSLRISTFSWNVESSVVHLLLNHPLGHWQYCTIVFRTKMIVFNDSLTTYTDEKDQGRSVVWEQLKKFLNFVYEHRERTFEEAKWSYTVCNVPQQKEKGGKVNCAVYSIVFLLYGVIQGLSGSSFENTQRWITVRGDEVSNFTGAFVKALKHLICGAILRESEIWDILFLFVPNNNLSQQRKLYWTSLQARYHTKMEFKVLNVKSFNFFD
jgi:hypothetical protein